MTLFNVSVNGSLFWTGLRSGGRASLGCRRIRSSLVVRGAAMNQPDQSSIFEMQPSRGHVTLWDARDAYETCSLCDDLEARQSCYAQFGCDQRRVDLYLKTVSNLEEQISKVSSPQPGNNPFLYTQEISFGPFSWRFLISYFCIVNCTIRCSNTKERISVSGSEGRVQIT
eukprot:jgi/Botrbrau1/11365/Bobra.0038s0113.1